MTSVALPSGVTVSHTGSAPYKARPASDRDQRWPVWLVVDDTGFNGLSITGSTAKFMNKETAVIVAGLLNGEIVP